MNIMSPSAEDHERRSALAGEERPSDPRSPAYARDPLWARITNFAMDDPGSRLPFSLRLARENGWSRHFAIRVVGEYRRFCYLAIRAGHSVSPSDEVDQAWHLHLLYTQVYWDFCGRVLGRPLHHNPTRGGPDERAKFHDHYAKTLASYRRIFGFDPPPDIWPPVDARFANAGAFRHVDTTAYWLVPKPRWRLLRRLVGASRLKESRSS
jgi:hypothetical protein